MAIKIVAMKRGRNRKERIERKDKELTTEKDTGTGKRKLRNTLPARLWRERSRKGGEWKNGRVDCWTDGRRNLCRKLRAVIVPLLIAFLVNVGTKCGDEV